MVLLIKISAVNCSVLLPRRKKLTWCDRGRGQISSLIFRPSNLWLIGDYTLYLCLFFIIVYSHCKIIWLIKLAKEENQTISRSLFGGLTDTKSIFYAKIYYKKFKISSQSDIKKTNIVRLLKRPSLKGRVLMHKNTQHSHRSLPCAYYRWPDSNIYDMIYATICKFTQQHQQKGCTASNWLVDLHLLHLLNCVSSSPFLSNIKWKKKTTSL